MNPKGINPKEMEKNLPKDEFPFGDDIESEVTGETADGYSSQDDEYGDFIYPEPKESFSYSLICFIAIAVIVVFGVIAVNWNSASITVVMNFPEIADGCNPDGSPFDIYDFVSDEVLSEVSSKLDNRISVNTLKAHLWVSGAASEHSYGSVRQSILDGVENFSYFPSSYTITYSVISDTVKSQGIVAVAKGILSQIGLPSKSEVLRAIGETYSEYYDKTYVNTGDMLSINWDGIKDADHFNRVSGIRRVINKMSRYLGERYEEDVTFVSKDGVGFGDLSEELSGINSVDVGNYESFILQNGITSEKQILLKQLRSVLIRNNEQYDRSVAEHNVIKEGIELYDPNITKVVFIPALDEENEFYMNRTQIGIDYLTQSAEDAKHNADEAKNISSKYDNYIKQFSTDSGNNDELLKRADSMSEEIMNKLDAFSERAIAVNNEYIESEVYEKVEVHDVVSGVGISGSLISALKTAVIWSAFFYILYFVYNEAKKQYIKYFKTGKEGDDPDDCE